MDLRQLENFIAVMRDGSLSGAARRIRVAQPTLSQQIRALEEEFGEPLLLRKPRGVEPTPAGRILLEHARQMVEEADRLRARFDHRREVQEGHLDFGIIPTLAPYLLPRVLGRFRSAFPRMDIRIREAKTRELIAQVVDGSIEFAILSDVTAQERKKWSLHVRELFREPLRLAVPSSHSLAQNTPVPKPGDLDAAHLIHLREGHCLTDRTLKVCRISNPDPRLECDQLETALAMVAAGMGLAVVPDLAVRFRTHSGITIRSFAEPTPERTISLMKKRAAPLSKAAEEWIKLVSGAARD